ncbi:unnamed protein product, partial [Iphiclides podalirius]
MPTQSRVHYTALRLGTAEPSVPARDIGLISPRHYSTLFSYQEAVTPVDPRPQPYRTVTSPTEGKAILFRNTTPEGFSADRERFARRRSSRSDIIDKLAYKNQGLRVKADIEGAETSGRDAEESGKRLNRRICDGERRGFVHRCSSASAAKAELVVLCGRRKNKLPESDCGTFR